MARYNEILVGRYNRLVQKLFQMKGPASLVTISDELVSVLPFFNGAENRYLEGWDRFGIAVNTVAVAAQTGGIRARNPAGSNVMVVVEKLMVSGTTAADVPLVQLNTPFADLGTLVSPDGIRFDPRGRAQGALILSFASNVASIGGTFGQFNVPATGQYDFIVTDFQEFPILPGDTLQVLSGNVNLALRLILMWRERFLEDAERT